MRFYTDRFILSPGPTGIPHRVRLAMARETTNPDLDPGFLRVYEGVRGKLRELLKAGRSDLYVMAGEAVLGLEAAIANLLRPGDRVVVVANGVFGEGFADIVRMYGGEPILVASENWRRGVSLEGLDRALERFRDASLVTLVHCDTPSAILNDFEGVARTVRSYGIPLVVDAVSSIGGVPVDFDGWGVDFIIGGSQKVLNAPTGLTIVALRRDLWDRVEKVGYKGLYLNLKLWRDMLDGRGVFPYTMADTLVYALDEALNMIFEEGLENVYRRHGLAREASWRALEALGLESYPESIEYSSPTVTAIVAPRGVDEGRLREHLWLKYGVMLAGSWGKLEGKVFRVGHMGVQASRTHLIIAYTALARGLKDLGYEVNESKAVEAIEETFR